MKDLDLAKVKKVFFVGIGGIGISAIAKMMLIEGKTVLGSDISENIMTAELKQSGVEVYLGQSLELIPKDVDLIVYTIAIPKYDQQFFNELNKVFNIPILSYPQILSYVTAGKYTIAVAGTHGKTTTTAMIAKILIDTKHDPSVILGSLLKDSKSNLVVGKSNFFVVEACEYERSFLNLRPHILVITNIEADHLDYYKDLADIKKAFGELILQTEDAIIYNTEDKNTNDLMQEYQKRSSNTGLVDYSKFFQKVPKLLVPGDHNRTNGAAALAVADLLNIPESDASQSLAGFSGTWRRLEKKGETKEGTIIYDDYAHHPTEIKASLQGLRELYPKDTKTITILFQPHLYSRTKALFDDFAKSFKGADRVLLLPIYFAREKKDESVSSEKLAEAIGGKTQAFTDFALAEKAVLELKLGSKDVFVTMGAGEAYKVADKIFTFK
jgi:UDP-N-acetylmuramate--alanine ligase